MEINQPVNELLKIFERGLKSRKRVRYCDYHNIDVNLHVRLEQDKSIEYYAMKVHELFINPPRNYHQPFLCWQLRECYRIVNTTLASFLPSIDAFRDELNKFKLSLEKNDYLAALIAQIDAGTLKTDLVCLGHGSWDTTDGIIDFAQMEGSTNASEVLVYSPLGATITNDLGVDIENEQYEPTNVVAKNIHLNTKQENYDFPLRFSRSIYRFLPNFCMVESKSLPNSRVIEPKTARVMFDLKTTQNGPGFFTLKSVLERFPKRRIHWALCTTVYNTDGEKIGPFVGYQMEKGSPNKKRKLENEKPENESWAPS